MDLLDLTDRLARPSCWNRLGPIIMLGTLHGTRQGTLAKDKMVQDAILE